jgi:hypothetical protein
MPPTRAKTRGPGETVLRDLLTFDRLLTGPVVHLIYWAGLAILALAGFSVIGASVGVAFREASWLGWLLAVPVLVAGLLGVGAMILIWRSFCELYVILFKVADDLSALRRAAEGEVAAQRPTAPTQPPAGGL